LPAAVKEQLVELCAYYLIRVKLGAQPADPVARFHLRNGARLERINWLSDTSAVGLLRSAGLMVNYLYRCRDRRRAFDAFASARRATASPEVARLARRISSRLLR
jgi:malonyl-CoA decarboxylase